MKSVDLNLLIALDALLDTGSVSAAAGRLHTSTPTMSRTLARLRRAFGDPILVRAGREMVLTPRALAVRDEVHQLVEQAQRLFLGADTPDLATLQQTFTLQASDMIEGTIALPLFAALRSLAPGVRVRFVSEASGGPAGLRDGVVDLQIGVIADPFPESQVQEVLRDTMVAVVRAGHPLLDNTMTVERFAAAEHLSASRKGKLSGPVDERLAELGLARTVVTAIPSYTAAMQMLAQTDLVGLAPRRLCQQSVRLLGLRTIPVPLELPTMVISQAWHARYEADPAHRWLRQCVAEVCQALG